ncbi:lipoprotein [Paenibacillus sp. J2TS4]|uniref:LptM family lipoprotein n=1 Tax=Paenibacillus sp. J2TS4 TaxID=2807194 RepID=UPI001BD0BADD|nr:hypothetical protein [Paenibacillus sp. J2TS4]
MVRLCRHFFYVKSFYGVGLFKGIRIVIILSLVALLAACGQSKGEENGPGEAQANTPANSDAAATISKGEYNQIKNGMSYEEIIEIIGGHKFSRRPVYFSNAFSLRHYHPYAILHTFLHDKKIKRGAIPSLNCTVYSKSDELAKQNPTPAKSMGHQACSVKFPAR